MAVDGSFTIRIVLIDRTPDTFANGLADIPKAFHSVVVGVGTAPVVATSRCENGGQSEEGRGDREAELHGDFDLERI